MKIRLAPMSGGHELDLTIELRRGQSGDVFVVRHRDVETEVSLGGTTDGPTWLRVGPRVIPFRAIRRDGVLEVWLAGHKATFRLIDGGARRSGARHSGPNREHLMAPMPGTVTKINVPAGATFVAHQPLMIMISMKMELALSVPHAGRVAEVHCREGQLVDMGAMLARLEPAEDEPSTA